MIRDVQASRQWEGDECRREPVDVQRNLAIMEALFEEAKALGVWESQDPLEGFEVKLRLARALNTPLPRQPRS